MTVIALSWEDRNALIEALESRSPAVRRARVANALLLLAKGVPAATVADCLFLPEAAVAQYWQAFLLGQRAEREAASFDLALKDGQSGGAVVTSLAPPPLRDRSDRRRWVQDLHGTRAR
jgi:hypothetical protein